MNLGKISFTDADAINRSVTLNTERRHQFRIRKPEPETNLALSRVCDGCNLHRTPHEFAGHRLCNVCRGKGKR